MMNKFRTNVKDIYYSEDKIKKEETICNNHHMYCIYVSWLIKKLTLPSIESELKL